MQAIQQGMQSLLPAIVSGNWKAVAETGTRIQHSYIMNQQLTDEHMQELQQLPAAFLELDQSFHRSAGRLAQAAQMKNPEVVSFYFYRLTDTCVACHGQFAVNRFPELATTDSHGEQHH
jgi:aspartate/tyrosine/aromatic aminotransferase